jgi:hypothetical protein
VNGSTRAATAITTAGATRHYAFGLEIDGDFPIPHVASVSPTRGARQLKVEAVESHAIDRGWKARSVESIVDRRFPDGRPFMSIDHDPDRGFRIWAPRYGRYEVSLDGRRIRSAIPRRGNRWERLFFAQAVPLAAALQRVGLFHASAVTTSRGVAAFVAPSGTGKTSIAAHLIAHGGTLVTDDVLALESIDGVVMAHPGTGVLCIDPLEAQRLDRPIGTVVGQSDKLHLSTRLVDSAAPLHAIFYLERGDFQGEPGVRRIEPPDPQFLLASTFISYLRSPQYLLDHLNLCAQVAATVALFKVSIPTGSTAANVVAEIESALLG